MSNTERPHNRRSLTSRIFLAVSALALAVGIIGCELDSYMDPSVIGRWEQAAGVAPILDRIDIIEDDDNQDLPLTQVQPSDLVPDIQEYTIGSGDLITVTVFELVLPGQDSVQTRRIDETGTIRLQIVGPIKAAGMTPSQLEQVVIETLEARGILRDATVSVIVQESRQNTYTVFGEPIEGGSAIGIYTIPKPEFRLLDALAQARGIPGRTKRLLIFRTAPLTPESEAMLPLMPGLRPEEDQEPTDAIDDVFEGLGEEPSDTGMSPDADPLGELGMQEQPATGTGAPSALERGLDPEEGGAQWIYVNGRWVRSGQPQAPVSLPGEEAPQTEDPLASMITQRIIEIPYDKLLAGDMRYNIVVRPGDTIRVPEATGGFVYIGGAINRPGAYSVPGENDLTLGQLIFAAGNLSPIAIPERVELTRRISDNQQASIRLNLRAIFDMTEPDIYLKPNDRINIGTNFVAAPLAVIRNGFRMSYGFGFVLDRNFDENVFGPRENN
ncbi:polysaccharide biosynthesis/export family protein [Mucisphaera calidilacus]|uniref:Polysaccharide biosynthesis/export protein n=1 Tax=Mucisphaera calidilacus TaxID=2527982 RepID=A0A518BTF7_9BACT|nr:polysaccharide biosynthesis/export family protein [Mucisphaera calidilacus]QDU70257.1 Polysaccharide biosynthesis/export protein [Mucisphaera calidilacus]